MRQQNDKTFHSLLTKAGKELLNNNDIDTLNNKIACSIPTNNFDKNVVIIQRNETRHIINRLQIKRLTQANGQDIILFSDHHSRTKKEGGQVVENRELLTIQDREGNYIRPGLLYYYKKMPACLLSNVCTKLGMINGA